MADLNPYTVASLVEELEELKQQHDAYEEGWTDLDEVLEMAWDAKMRGASGKAEMLRTMCLELMLVRSLMDTFCLMSGDLGRQVRTLKDEVNAQRKTIQRLPPERR